MAGSLARDFTLADIVLYGYTSTSPMSAGFRPRESGLQSIAGAEKFTTVDGFIPMDSRLAERLRLTSLSQA